MVNNPDDFVQQTASKKQSNELIGGRNEASWRELQTKMFCLIITDVASYYFPNADRAKLIVFKHGVVTMATSKLM